MIDSFHIGAYWNNRKQFFYSVISPTFKTLKGLSEIDEQFVNLYELGWSRKKALEHKFHISYENIKQLYQKDVKKNDLDQDGYSKIGYRLSLWTGHKDGEASGISFGVGMGYERLTNSCVISIPFEGPATERLLHLNKVKEILTMVIQNWDPDFAVLNSRKLSNTLDVMNQIGWVTYLRTSKNKFYSNTGIVHEKNFNGGHLFYLQTENGLAYDYESIDKLLSFKKAMLG
jgi:hypothetical protein